MNWRNELENVEIVRVTIKDIVPLQEISRQTFKETFAADNTEENMRKYLSENLSLEQLTTELENPDSEFYFARQDGKVTGYLKLNYSFSQTELKGENTLEIERIYVLQEYQGQKIGQRLLEKALQRTREIHAGAIWLGVWERNERAIRFYLKNGFSAFGRHIFMLGNDEQTDIMMRKEVNDD